MNSPILVIGCPVGGRSTVIDELVRRGLFVVLERVDESSLARGGNALPWTNMAAFARRARGGYHRS